jgi:hypothetical protein
MAGVTPVIALSLEAESAVQQHNDDHIIHNIRSQGHIFTIK